MIYTDMTKKAMIISYKAHDGQLDKGGVPYVFHPFHVAEQFNDEKHICVALLHDVVEDTDVTIEDIANFGFDDEIVQAVKCLTKPKGMDYFDYIEIVKTNPIAIRVKLADLEHNSMEGRLDYSDESTLARLSKYKKAKEILERELYK